MKRAILLLFLLGALSEGQGHENVTVDAVPLQLREFKNEHPIPIGAFTTSSGAPVELRSTITVNSDIFANDYHLDLTLHRITEKIPERIVHAKGNGAFGYFVVTHDVSKYTSADVFNGIGKKTSVFGRFSTAIQSQGGPELGRETKGLSVKMYTKEGNLDFLCLANPVYEYKDPIDFVHFIRAFHRNPKTNIFDATSSWDFITKRPEVIHSFLWKMSDYGIPLGYRRMDIFPIHAYELHNAHGDRYLAKFNFRTEQGLANLTDAQARAISSQDPDFFTRDLYNAIANKEYPSWRLEMDIMPLEAVRHLDYNPYDVTRYWNEGTYKTVTIGRLVFDKHSDNNFRDAEQSAFNPANLVPGIPGPVDFMFKARRLSYQQAHKHRIQSNPNYISVNLPKYVKTYTRDGDPPLRDNMNDVPNYYPNSFNGPVPIIEASRPSEKIVVLDKNSVDLEPVSYFYNHFVKEEGHRQRMAGNTAALLLTAEKDIVKRALQLLTYIDADLGRRVTESYIQARHVADEAAKLDTVTRYEPLAECMDLFSQGRLKEHLIRH